MSKRDQSVLVMFDVRGRDHEAAARLVRDRLIEAEVLDAPERSELEGDGIEAWFLGEGQDREIDRSDRESIIWFRMTIDDECGENPEDDEQETRRPQQRTRDRLRWLTRKARIERH